MNILFLTYQGDIAGSTNSISYLAKGLAEKGHNVYVGCRKESLLYEILSNTKVNLIGMKFKRMLYYTFHENLEGSSQTSHTITIRPSSSCRHFL